jgi:hypothetical protein
MKARTFKSIVRTAALLMLLLLCSTLSGCFTDVAAPDAEGIARWTEDGHQYARKDGATTCSLVRVVLNGQEVYRGWFTLAPDSHLCPFDPDGAQ